MPTIAETARTHAIHTAQITKDAILSRTYLYPPLGVLYFLRHPSLWPPMTARILPCIILSVAVIVPMFFFTYLPQAAILSVLNGPVGAFNAVLLVCNESTTIISAIARSFLLEGALYDEFDATLICEGQEKLVATGREVKAGGKHEGAHKLGALIKKPLEKFSVSHLVEYLCLLPLNLIPIVGTAVFLIMQGRKSGPSYHARYFQLKQFDALQRERFLQVHKGGYVAFGTASMAMNLVPLASILFSFTSTIGAALWAADIEKEASYPGEKVDMNGKEAGEKKKEL